MPPILILSPQKDEDPCVVSVCEALEKQGGEPWVLETRSFPTHTPFALTLGAQEALQLAGRDARALASVWIRDIEMGFPEGMDPVHQNAAEIQASAALWSMLECLDVFMLDPPEVLLSALHKPYLGKLAQRAGLEIPRTLVTNDPAAVRHFAQMCSGGIVCKLIESGALGIRTGQGVESFPTQRLDAEALEDLEGLAFGPMIFQEEIPKALELRITVVGPEMFVAAVDPKGEVDWRQNQEIVRAFRPYTHLPSSLRQALFRLVDRLGMNFATIDMILCPDGRYVFLEINSISWFDHVERHAGLPISEAVAALLLGRLPPRVGPWKR